MASGLAHDALTPALSQREASSSPLPFKEGGQGARSLTPEWSHARRFLCARLDNIGDVLMVGPALRAIKETLPEARITLWASPGGAAAAELLSVVDEVLPTRAIWQDLGHMAFDPGRELELVEQLRRGEFDAAIIFTSFSQSPWPPAYACYLAGIPLRAGQSKEFGGSLLTDWVRPRPDDLHQVERSLFLVESLGFRASRRELFAVPGERAWVSTRALLQAHGIEPGQQYVVLNSTASAAARRYSPSRFAEVGRLLRAETGHPIVLTGVERERGSVEELAAAIGPGAVPLVGKTDLPELAALIGDAALVISNNTSTMHLADALGRPSVILFAGTELESQWRPRSSPTRLLRRPTWCSPCYRFTCPYDHECLDIPPAEVVAAALDLLEGENEKVRDGARLANEGGARQEV